MKPGKTIYYLDSEGAPQKAVIAIKKTVTLETKDGKKESTTYTLEGKKGEFSEESFSERMELIIADIVKILT